jgi:hypothetical protein
MAKDVEQCLSNFYGSEIFAGFKKLPQENWLEIEYPLPLDETLGHTPSSDHQENGAKPFCEVDLPVSKISLTQGSLSIDLWFEAPMKMRENPSAIFLDSYFGRLTRSRHILFA